MNSSDFLDACEEKLLPVTPMVTSVINKQLQDMGLARDMMSPHQAEILIRRVSEALKLFLGPSGAETARAVMLKELRKRAPDYFASQGL